MESDQVGCLLCGDKLDMNYGNPSGGTVFTSRGNYGSTLFDPSPFANTEHLKVVVCDTCLKLKAEQGVIQHFAVVKYEEPIYKVATWKPGD